MQELKHVKSRLVFFKGNITPNGKDHMDVTSTWNLTQRDFKDRNPDMEVESDQGERYLIDKKLVAAIKEIKVISQETVEVKGIRKIETHGNLDGIKIS